MDHLGQSHSEVLQTLLEDLAQPLRVLDKQLNMQIPMFLRFVAMDRATTELQDGRISQTMQFSDQSMNC